MNRKNDKESPSDQLPKLGIQPYLQLMDTTARQETDRQSSHLGLYLLWLGDHVLDAVDLTLSPFGITESKLDMLLLLTLHNDRDHVTPSALADRMGIRRASITVLLDWLEKRGLIAREPSSVDRRMINVKITEDGRKLVDSVLPDFWSSCSSLVDDLDPEEQAVLNKILAKLNASIERKLGVGR